MAGSFGYDEGDKQVLREQANIRQPTRDVLGVPWWQGAAVNPQVFGPDIDPKMAAMIRALRERQRRTP